MKTKTKNVRHLKHNNVFQTGTHNGPEARVQIFFGLGDMHDIEISAHDAALIMGVSMNDFRTIMKSDDSPIVDGEALTLGSVSNWVEAHINNFKYHSEGLAEQQCFDHFMSSPCKAAG